jgi:carboxymethylenebutenolidase
MQVTRLLALPLALTACSSSPSPHRLTGAGITPAVWGVVELPAAPGPHAAVILLPGSYGWRPDYARFAKAFADSGFVALAVDYYAETGRGSTPAEERAHWPAWQATVRNAVTYLEATPAVAGRPIGLVGYSRGAFLAISVADSAPPIGAVVDFYGGGSDADPPSHRIQFPPLLILHGEADTEVPVALAHRLYDRMRAGGGDVEMHLYPGAGHVFNAPWASSYSASDATDAWMRTIVFLKRRLHA